MSRRPATLGLAFGLTLVGLGALAGCRPQGSQPSVEPSSPPAEASSPVPAGGTERPDWGAAFEAAGARGTFVLLDPSTERVQRYNPERAAERLCPASTFKVYNALVALETGVVGDADSLFVWDGRPQPVAAWERDHSLRSGMAASTVWLYRAVARRVGRDRYAEAFAREPFGNSTIGPDEDLFWLDNSLRASADEQVRFMDRLRQGALAFSPGTQARVRDLLPVLVEAADGRRLVGKTGWASFDGTDVPDVGWLVGWVEGPAGPSVFALNVEAAHAGFQMIPARLAIARVILVGEGLLPAEEPALR